MVDQDRVAARVRQLTAGRPAVVALSGGADSAALALAAQASGSPVRAVHVHHGQPSSDELAAAARAVASELGLDLDVVLVTVPDSDSFETAARHARYRALNAALADLEVLLVGHTADDQAETVLQRLARGSGPSGLAAMRAETGRVLRPLLAWRRSEMRALAEQSGLPFFDDPANLDPRHTRVAIREDVLPALERIQPGATSAMARYADLAGAVDDHLDGQAATALHGLRLSLAAYRSLDGFLRVRALRLLALRMGRRAPGAGALARMHSVAMGVVPTAQVDEGFEVVRVGAYLELLRSCRVPPTSTELESTLRGWGDWRFEVAIESGRPTAWPLSPWRAVVPVGGVLTVRALRPDDTSGSRRFSDELTGLPVHERRCWPVVELDGRLIWVPGVRRLDVGSIARGQDGYRWLIADRRDPWTSERS